MNFNKFNPDDVGIFNGNYFGFPNNPDDADIVLINVPWDVTASYSAGTSKAPKSIIKASTQLDFFDFEIENAWKTKIASINIDNEIIAWNSKLRPKAEKIIKCLEKGKQLTDKLKTEQLEINNYAQKLNQYIKQQSLNYLKQGCVVGIVGGDHSTPLGLIQALSELYPDFGILHIDAHADLRNSYEGFEFSHASAMFNVLKISNISKIVQIAVRDVSASEMNLIRNNNRIELFSDFEMKEKSFSGVTWDSQCNEIISKLPETVYISFDIDGLMPDLCPNTGTPVPGGLTFNEAIHLLHKLSRSGKKIIGFDLCEVGSSKYSDWDANVGARILYKLCVILLRKST